MSNLLKCPNCGTDIEISQALKQEVEAQIRLQERERAVKEAGEESRMLKEQLEEKNKKLAETEKAEMILRKEKNLLVDEKRSWELEKQRQLDKEREVIRQKTLEEAVEQQRLKDKEKDLMIEGLKKSLEDAKRRADQGSQQTQGEVQELDLEENLAREFPGDGIEPVAKGTLGADIRQIVKSPKGIICGSILWESKRTKAWSDGWLGKLKDDLRADKADIPIIVSDSLPEEAKKGIGFKDGVWICSPVMALIMARLLRDRLLAAARERVISQSKQSKAEEIFSYVTSNEFQQQVESLVETYTDMREQINKERVAFEKSWKQREAQVNRLLSGVSGIYGYMQGIAGSALPSIKRLELESEGEA